MSINGGTSPGSRRGVARRFERDLDDYAAEDGREEREKGRVVSVPCGRPSGGRRGGRSRRARGRGGRSRPGRGGRRSGRAGGSARRLRKCVSTGKKHRDAAKRAITIIIAAPVVAAVVASSIVVAVVAAAEVVPLLLDAAGDLDGAVLVACACAAFRASSRQT